VELLCLEELRERVSRSQPYVGATRQNFKCGAIGRVRLRVGVLEAATVAEAGYRAMMSGRRVVVPGLYNQAQILLARLLPSSLMVRMAKAMLQPLS
jgi:short-subunit dehydrogenase